MLTQEAKDKINKFKFENRYIVVCDSCGEVFADLSVAEYLEAKGNYAKCRWYFKAAYHWIDNQEHEINVYLVVSSERQLVFQLSQSWRQELQYEPDQSVEAMKRELKHLESGV